jgi:hypothetical protein
MAPQRNKAKQQVLNDLLFFINNNDPLQSGIPTSDARRVLGGVLGTAKDKFSGPLEGLFGTQLVKAGKNLESNIRTGLRVIGRDQVHHIVPLGLLRDALAPHPVKTQEQVLKMIVEEGLAPGTGNVKKNLESILEFTHFYAGGLAAHPQGDTVQAYLRPKVLKPGASAKDIFESLKPTIQTATQQYNQAVSPGTVEAAKRMNLEKQFSDLYGMRINPHTMAADELTGIKKASGEEFLRNLEADPVGAFREQVSAEQLSRFEDFRGRQLIKEETGFNRGMRDLAPQAMPMASGSGGPSFGDTIKAWLATQNLEDTKENKKLAKQAIQAQYDQSLQSLKINKPQAKIGKTLGKAGKLGAAAAIGQALLSDNPAEAVPIAAETFTPLGDIQGAPEPAITMVNVGGKLRPLNTDTNTLMDKPGYGLEQKGGQWREVQRGTGAATQQQRQAVQQTMQQASNLIPTVNKAVNPVGARITNEAQYFIVNPIRSAYDRIFGKRDI